MDKAVIILGRIEDVPKPSLSSVPITAGCGCRCWISQDAVRLKFEDASITTSCTECADWSEAVDCRPVPGAQASSVADAVGQDMANLIRAVVEHHRRKQEP